MNPNIKLMIPPKSNVDHSKMKLGKAPVIHDKRTLKLSNYLNDSALPKLPDTFIWNTDIDKWGVMKNDVIGDCTIAAAGHLIMGWNNDLGIAVNSDADNPTNTGGDGGTLANIGAKAKALLKNPYVQYALIGTGVLVVSSLLYRALKKK